MKRANFFLHKVHSLTIILLIIVPTAIFAQPLKIDTKSAPQRVIILDMGSLETFYELGIPVIAGPDHVPSYLKNFNAQNPGYQGVGNVAKANLAAIAALKPDLIIIGGRLRSVYDSLSAIAPTMLPENGEDDFWTGFEANVKKIATMYGKEQLAEKKLATLRQKADRVREKSKNDTGKALFVLHVNERFNPNGPGSRFGFGYDVLGLQSAYTPEPSTNTAPRTPRGTNSEGQAPSGEQVERPKPIALSQINPDYLFIIDRATGIKGTIPMLADLINDDIKATNAFKNNKVFVLPGSVWYLSGSGLTSVDQKITEIGEKLYGIKF